MSHIKIFTFNPFQENTYIVSNDKKECLIFDPGCSNANEEKILSDYIATNGLNPKRLINTHCHIDHILGNSFVAGKYGLKLEAHKLEEPVLESGTRVSQMYGVPYTESPGIAVFLEEGKKISLGELELEMIHVPGHSPGSICFLNKAEKYIIGGDVLFDGSIGRTDLPGGDHETLISSIKTKLFILEEDIKVFPGHGPHTTIGKEKKSNPFLV